MTGEMRAIIKPTAGPGAAMTRVPIPGVGPRDVLVKVKATAICGTDIHIYNWDPWSQSRIHPPRVFGHEFCGEVVEVGPQVRSTAPGDFVSAETHITCGVCFHCRTGKGHICQNVEIIGVDRDGCFAEYITVPEENIWKVAPDVPVEIAAIHDPLGNAVHTVFSADVAANTVAIIGVGPIGLCAIPISRMAGATRVFVTDVNEYRLDLARKLGADVVVNSRREDPVKVMMDTTGGMGVDVVLEMSGHPDGIRQGLAALRKGGQMSLLGLPSRPVEIDLADAVIFKGAILKGISGREMFATWYRVAALLRAGLDVSTVITHRFPLDDFEKAMELARSGNCGKIVLYP